MGFCLSTYHYSNEVEGYMVQMKGLKLGKCTAVCASEMHHTWSNTFLSDNRVFLCETWPHNDVKTLLDVARVQYLRVRLINWEQKIPAHVYTR